MSSSDPSGLLLEPLISTFPLAGDLTERAETYRETFAFQEALLGAKSDHVLDIKSGLGDYVGSRRHCAPDQKEIRVADSKDTNDPVAYRSTVRIERVKGPIRRAYVPAHDGPVMLGVHSEVAEHYGVDNNVVDPYTTTLDYVVAAVAG